MKYLCYILPIVLLAGCSTASHQVEAKTLFDTLPQVELKEAEIEITLIVGQAGRRYVPLELHGRTILFLLDTGASATIVSAAVARDEGIATIPVPHGTLYGGGGGSSASVGLIDELRVNGVVISRLPVFFTDMTEWNVKEQSAQKTKIDGILGSGLLEQLGASIDYTTNTLTIRKPNRAAQTSGLRPSVSDL